MKTYYVRANEVQQVRSLLSFKGQSQVVKFDASPWEDDNGAVLTVEWTLKSGQAGISAEGIVGATTHLNTTSTTAFRDVDPDQIDDDTEDMSIFSKDQVIIVNGSASNDGIHTITNTPTVNTFETSSDLTTEISQSVVFSGGGTTVSALITTAQAGSSLISLKLSSATESVVLTLRVVAKDPEYRIHDYGICA